MVEGMRTDRATGDQRPTDLQGVPHLKADLARERREDEHTADSGLVERSIEMELPLISALDPDVQRLVRATQLLLMWLAEQKTWSSSHPSASGPAWRKAVAHLRIRKHPVPCEPLLDGGLQLVQPLGSSNVVAVTDNGQAHVASRQPCRSRVRRRSSASMWV